MVRNRTTKVSTYTKTNRKSGRRAVVKQHRRILPRKPVRRIIFTQGAVRVSDKAADELSDELELHGKKVSRQAVKYARKDGRQTVKDRDIKKASKDFHSSFHKEN